MTACLLYKTIRSPQDAINLQQDLFAMQTWEDTMANEVQHIKMFCEEDHPVLEIQNSIRLSAS